MTFRFARFWLFSFATALAPAAAAEVLFRGNFESGNLMGWSTLNPMTGTRENIRVVEMPVFEGMHAAEIVIHPDDLWPNNHNRVELHYDAQRTAEGNTMFFSWYFRLPANAQTSNDIAYWESAQSYQQTMAFWIQPADGGTQLSFRTNNPGMTRFTGPISINEWHQITMQVLWSQDAATGRVHVWLDGDKIVDNASARTKPDANAVFVQLGYHRNSSESPVETIYIDNAIEATTLAEVLGTSGMGGAPAAAGASGMGGAGGGNSATGGTSASGGTSGSAGANDAGSSTAGSAGTSTLGGSGGQGGANAAGTTAAGTNAGLAGMVGIAGVPGASGNVGAAGTLGSAGVSGAPGSASSNPDEGGCGCRASGRTGKNSAAWLLTLACAFWLRRRR